MITEGRVTRFVGRVFPMHKILRIATEQFKVADVYCFMHVGNMHIMGLVAPSSCTAIEDSRSTCELMRM